jgi:hypothetical protein
LFDLLGLCHFYQHAFPMVPVILIGMFESFLLKQMVTSKLKDIPEDQQEKILNTLEKNPDFFMNIAGQIQEKVKAGKSERHAVEKVMLSNKEALQKIFPTP